MGAWIGDIPPETAAARLREAVALALSEERAEVSVPEETL